MLIRHLRFTFYESSNDRIKYIRKFNVQFQEIFVDVETAQFTTLMKHNYPDPAQ
jgi:hypothetical protein